MSFTEAITTCITKYCDFRGRARRSEYWYYRLAAVLVTWLINGAARLLFGRGSTFTDLIASLVALALFLPGLGVTVRRMHDIGKSGWAILIVLVPLVGFILFLVWLCRDSLPGENRYGMNPKGNYGYQPGYSYQQPNYTYQSTASQQSGSYTPNGSYNPNPGQSSNDSWYR